MRDEGRREWPGCRLSLGFGEMGDSSCLVAEKGVREGVRDVEQIKNR
jgi:hypothetical protein